MEKVEISDRDLFEIRKDEMQGILLNFMTKLTLPHSNKTINVYGRDINFTFRRVNNEQ